MTGKPIRELTEGDLRAAFELHRMPSWPATFEAAFAEPITRRQIEIFAARLPKIRPATLDLIRAGIVQTTPTKPLIIETIESFVDLTPRAPRVLDQKSKAAGERDEDEA